MIRTYLATIEIDDYSESADPEDIEQILVELLCGERPEGVPEDMAVRILEVNESDEN